MCARIHVSSSRVLNLIQLSLFRSTCLRRRVGGSFKKKKNKALKEKLFFYEKNKSKKVSNLEKSPKSQEALGSKHKNLRKFLMILRTRWPKPAQSHRSALSSVCWKYKRTGEHVEVHSYIILRN